MHDLRTVYIHIRKPKAYRVITEVVDAESGELLLQKWQDDISAALAAGERVMHAEVCVTVEETPAGAVCHTISSEDGYCLPVFQHKQKRVNQFRYVKLYFGRLLALAASEREALLMLAPYLRQDGRLMRGRRPLDTAGLYELWGLRQSQGYQRLAALREKGALEKRKGGYYLSKEFLSRG